MGRRDRASNQESEQAVTDNSGCMRILSWFLLLTVMFYMGIHVYFLWQPTGKPDAINARLMNAKLMGVQIFPAVRSYPVVGIAGRSDVIDGEPEQTPKVKQRLALAVERNYPVTFREEEINAWLAKRVNMNQGGALAPYVEIRGVWVNFKEDELELIIERKLPWANSHVSSLYMGFKRTRAGYSISRHSCHIGQLNLPGGFGYLLMPAFQNIVDELADELQPYHDHEIYDVRVQEGKITIDPRRVEQRL
ncbi:MAG: hypothetical protein P8P36_07035 [Akkermansiaceae bacterium]|nr:hypothetical protein [Akkermansiaceae bacterium]